MIRDRLDDGESVVMWVRQSRIKPGSVGGNQPEQHIRHREASHHQEPGHFRARRTHRGVLLPPDHQREA